MTWTAPVVEEVSCGMEINMYFPAEGEDESEID
jgi:coenzyme PQQ precursor peptide PqqA